MSGKLIDADKLDEVVRRLESWIIVEERMGSVSLHAKDLRLLLDALKEAQGAMRPFAFSTE